MPKVLFVLPVKGGSGGAHSVVQEVSGMRQLGVDAGILVNERNFTAFRRNYARFSWLEEACQSFTGPKDLAERVAGADLVVATTNTSVHSIAEAQKAAKLSCRTAYYVQDYEPLFYEAGSESWNIAISSFNLLRDCTYFAKTRWLRDIVRCAHGHEVAQVTPSIDRSVYFPARRPRTDGRRTVVAMVRPATPRRGSRRTMRVLGRLAAAHERTTDFVVFGTTARELQEYNIQTYSNVDVAGVLLQPEVGALLQRADFFLDLSDYQAFGRTAAEAMACGVVALAPMIGGACEFIEHGVSSFLVDTLHDSAIMDMIERMLSMTEEELAEMRIAALEAVASYTPQAAAISELRAFGFLASK